MDTVDTADTSSLMIAEINFFVLWYRQLYLYSIIPFSEMFIITEEMGSRTVYCASIKWNSGLINVNHCEGLCVMSWHGDGGIILGFSY